MSNSNNTRCPPQALFWFYKRSTVNPFHGNVLWEISLQSLTRKWIWVQLQCDKHCDWLEINHNIDFLQSQLFPIRGKQTLERTFLIKSKYISTFESFIYGNNQLTLSLTLWCKLQKDKTAADESKRWQRQGLSARSWRPSVRPIEAFSPKVLKGHGRV